MGKHIFKLFVFRSGRIHSGCFFGLRLQFTRSDVLVKRA